MTKRERRTFTSEFKKQMIQLYQSGKTRKALIEECHGRHYRKF
ncbi:hypothetical protein [Peribacillus simplex]